MYARVVVAVLLLQVGLLEAFSIKTAAANKPITPRTFLSTNFDVYIEDTDAYGIVYNGNYLKFYERTLGGAEIVEATRHKFKASPRMGDSFTVEASLKETLPNDNQVWNMVMKSNNNNDDDVIYNAATLTVGSTASITHAAAFDDTAGQFFADSFTVYRDEFDVSGRLPLRNFLNYCERTRTNFLGGSSGLRKCQEANLLWVVTSIDKCAQISSSEILRPGDEIQMTTSFITKRKGAMVKCQHTLLCGNERLAQAVVSIMAVNSETERPTTDLPEWLKERMGVVA